MKLDQIYQVAAHTRDLDETISFYRDTLNASYLGKFDPPGLVFFDFNGLRLLLEPNASKTMIYFWVDDIDQSYQSLKSKGVDFASEPHLVYRDSEGLFGRQGEEEWMAFFSDPSGNVLALVTRKPSQG